MLFYPPPAPRGILSPSAALVRQRRGRRLKHHLPRQGQGLQNAEDEREPLVMPLKEKWTVTTGCVRQEAQAKKVQEN